MTISDTQRHVRLHLHRIQRRIQTLVLHRVVNLPHRSVWDGGRIHRNSLGRNRAGGDGQKRHYVANAPTPDCLLPPFAAKGNPWQKHT